MFSIKQHKSLVASLLILTVSTPILASAAPVENKKSSHNTSQHQGNKPSTKPVVVKPNHKPSNKPSNKPVVIKPGHKPPSKPVVIVKPSHKPVVKPIVVVKPPVRRSYRRVDLPTAAAFVMIAGISYAVINNAYYKHTNDNYVYVEQPPIAAPAVQNTVINNYSNAGQLVNTIPANATTVTIEGATFYVDGNDWYAPIAGTNQFVIVEPQL
ncbi:hypothetical protein BCU68_11350 [Vibrio sp. 10N.286.49.B3]|uniref:DUF6515 family protein n=1 Tax=Vibrio sp. 10N.286.49.B3 TaxID=1880855 RepID=UPI000C83836B|nr:DUF6515 family protein [Vibrio sp. 10N.286.49.B3]PMH45029.1 hypothetical protein BCU68_11350 [Vibrio sp. 10N.286.49.B3]